MMIQLTYNNIFETFDTNYDIIFKNKDNYDIVYISIGSKIYAADEGGYYQMFPNFLSDKRALIVVVDEFNNIITEDDLNGKAMLSYKDQHKETDIFVISGEFTPNELVEMYKEFLSRLEDVKYIIANYIRFRNDTNYSSAEMQFYVNFRDELDKFLLQLEQSKHLSNIYLWTGYNLPYLRNIIYSFDFYKNNKLFENTYITTSINPMFSLLKLIIQSNIDGELKCSDVAKIYEEIVSKASVMPRFLKAANTFISFCKSAIDIKCDKIQLMDETMPLLKGGRKKRTKSKKNRNKRKRRVTKKTNR